VEGFKFCVCQSLGNLGKLVIFREYGLVVYANPWMYVARDQWGLKPGMCFDAKSNNRQGIVQWNFCGTLLKDKITGRNCSPHAGIAVTSGPHNVAGVVTRVVKNKRVKAIVMAERPHPRLPLVLAKTKAVVITEQLHHRLRKDFSVCMLSYGIIIRWFFFGEIRSWAR
jgi:hypothetical protein